VNWLSPVKVRTTLIGGLKKMLVWNDLDPDEKIKVYDKGVDVKSRNGVPIRLSQERWEHIAQRHPEMREQKEKVLETVVAPNILPEGDLDTLMAVRHYAKTPVTEKYLIVVYREVTRTDGFILTAYFANETSERRRPLWRR
jgi:hypothetical protein